jgi:protein TonB
MPTETLPTRAEAPATESVSRGFVLALALHGLAFLGLFIAAWISHRANPHWGDRDPSAGSIQASMVNALPLPPRQRYLDKAVLATEKPSIAPTPPPPTPEPAKAVAPRPKAEPLPKPNEVLIPAKVQPRPKPRAPDREQPEPARRVVTPPQPPTPKATTGESAGIQIPQSVSQLKNGTATVTIDERSFGDRYAYYIRLVSQKINQSKQQDSDPPETRGKRSAVRFVITRDGTPVDAEIATRSGSAALDTSTLRAIQRIDSFGPLPAGDRITITFGYTSH